MIEGLPPLPEGYEKRMPRHAEANQLAPVGKDTSGRSAFLTPDAAAAWAAMRDAAAREGIELLLVSAYRDVTRQREIIRAKLSSGIPLAEILRVSAYPGFSEHHSGRAVDIGAPGCEGLTGEFEGTPQFSWLMERA